MRIRRVFFIVPVTAALLSAALSPAWGAYVVKHHARAAAHSHLKVAKVLRVAPADEYFGRLKMSILGIRNQLHDLDTRLQYTPEKSADVLGSAAYVEDALHDWEHKYPGDPWLAKDVFQLTQLYSHVHSNEGHRCASRTLHWLLGRYGKSRYAAQARTEILPVVK
jgi:hypothetical protein